MRYFFLFCFVFLIAISCWAFKEPTTIPTVIVSSHRLYEMPLTQGQKQLITRKDITDLGVTSLSQALQELGGVQLQNTTGNSNQVMLSMRGFGVNASSNTLVLINGIPLTNPDLAPPDINTIPLQEIEFVEVTSGTETVLYGDQAVGGSINIITRQLNKDKADLACEAGSYNFRSCSVLLAKKIKSFDISLGALTSRTDNYRQHNDYNQNLIFGNNIYHYQKGSLSFNYQIANELMQYPGALTAKQVHINRQKTTNNTDFFKDWNGFYHINHSHQLNSYWFLKTDLARREMHGNGILMSPFDQTRVVHYLKPQLQGQLGLIKTITGFDYEQDQYFLRSSFGLTDDHQHKYSLFSMANIPINQKWSLSIGARGAQQNNVLFNNFTTRHINKALATTLGLHYQLNPETKIYVRRAESFRFPKADEEASTPIGVDGLKTQRGVSYETGGVWQNKACALQLSLYQLNLRDEITFDPFQTPTQPFGANRNLSPTERHGLSFSEKWFLSKQIRLDAQYNFVSARFQNGLNAGKRIPLVSENIIHGGTNYSLGKNWNLYTEAIYTGNQYAANDDSNTAARLGGYTLFNLNLRYSVKPLSLSFRINNIFNKEYYFYSVYQPGFNQQFYYPAPERNFLLKIKYIIV